MDWQLIIVALCVLAAAVVVVRKLIVWLRPLSRGESACGGGCSGCTTSSGSPPVVELQPVKLP